MKAPLFNVGDRAEDEYGREVKIVAVLKTGRSLIYDVHYPVLNQNVYRFPKELKTPLAPPAKPC